MPKAPKGSLVPLVTPFRGGELDLGAYSALIEGQVSAGSHGVVVAGSTGEPGTLTLEERERLAECAVSTAAGRLTVIIGSGLCDLPSTLRLTKHAEETGADAVLVVTPYFLRPSQHGIIEYFKTVAASTELPIIVYDIPLRAGVALEVETIARLAEVDNIVGVKETRTDFEHMVRVLGRCGDDLAVYCGLETLCLPMLIIGGSGHVSATGNICPREMAQLADAAFAGDWETARSLHELLLGLNDAVFADTNPGPVKTMLGEMGLIDPEVRSPLAPLLPETREKVLATLAEFQQRQPSSRSDDAALATS